MTCFKDTLRAVIAVTAQIEWYLRSIDMKTTFHQGENLSTDVYLRKYRPEHL